MAQFKTGEYVRYTNKNEKADIMGLVIARQWDSHLIMIDDGSNFGSLYIPPNPTVHPTHGSVDRSYFVKRNPANEYDKSLCPKDKTKRYIWIGKSKNLVSGIIPYDPTQQGESDGDI